MGALSSEVRRRARRPRGGRSGGQKSALPQNPWVILAAEKMDRNSPGLGSVVSLLASVADQADTRIWGTLPDNIQLARFILPPGTYDVKVQLQGAYGRPGATRVFKDISVQAGQISFASLQWASFN